jgi:transcriptional regulator with XRE-family HTH domain
MHSKARTANKLAAWRIYRGFTQAEIAMRLGVNPNTVCGWEAGRSFPRPVHAARLARILRCAVEDLFPSRVG